MSSVYVAGRLGDSSTSPVIKWLATVLVFILPISAHSAEAFNYTSIGLLVVSVVYFGINWRDITVSPVAKLFIMGSFAFPVAIAINMLVFGDWQSLWLDNPSRLILVLPIFMLMAHIRLNVVWLCVGILLSACVFGWAAIYQGHFLGMVRVNGWITVLRSPITFGNAALLFSAMSVATYSFIKPIIGFKWAVLIVFAAAGLAGYASLLSGTRGGWVSVPLLLMTLLCAGSKRPLLANGFALLSAFLLFFVVYNTHGSVSGRIDSAWNELASMVESGVFTGGSVGTRLEMWWAAVLLFVDAPVWGVGLGGYHDAKLALIEQGSVTSNISRFGYAHNEPLHYLAEMGLMGLLPLLGFYLTGFLLILKYIRFNKSLAVMAMLVLVFRFDISLTQVQFVYHYTTLLYAMMFAVVAGLMCNPQYQDN